MGWRAEEQRNRAKRAPGFAICFIQIPGEAEDRALQEGPRPGEMGVREDHSSKPAWSYGRGEERQVLEDTRSRS